MWEDKILIWEDTPDSKWNNFGEITNEVINHNNDLYAKGIIIWRKITLGNFTDKIITLLGTSNDFLEDKNIITGVMLAISVMSFIPLHIEIIKDDDIASEFLSLIQRNEDKHYILKKDFNVSRFSKINSLSCLFLNLIENNLLIDGNDRYYLNGKILTSVHLWD